MIKEKFILIQIKKRRTVKNYKYNTYINNLSNKIKSKQKMINNKESIWKSPKINSKKWTKKNLSTNLSYKKANTNCNMYMGMMK